MVPSTWASTTRTWTTTSTPWKRPCGVLIGVRIRAGPASCVPVASGDERIDTDPRLAACVRAGDLAPEPARVERVTLEAAGTANSRALARLGRRDDERPVVDPHELDR